MANFRISFSKAVDSKTPAEQLVYRAYMSTVNNLTTREGIEQANMVGQKFDATFFEVFIDEPVYIQIVVFNNYGNIRFYRPRFINPVEELVGIDFDVSLINESQVVSGDMVILSPDTSDVIVGLRNNPQTVAAEFEAQDLDDTNIEASLVNDPQIVEASMAFRLELDVSIINDQQTASAQLGYGGADLEFDEENSSNTFQFTTQE
jgi:hypothetical protein